MTIDKIKSLYIYDHITNPANHATYCQPRTALWPVVLCFGGKGRNNLMNDRVMTCPGGKTVDSLVLFLDIVVQDMTGAAFNASKRLTKTDAPFC